jgi:hypothetical protein
MIYWILSVSLIHSIRVLNDESAIKPAPADSPATVPVEGDKEHPEQDDKPAPADPSIPKKDEIVSDDASAEHSKDETEPNSDSVKPSDAPNTPHTTTDEKQPSHPESTPVSLTILPTKSVIATKGDSTTTKVFSWLIYPVELVFKIFWYSLKYAFKFVAWIFSACFGSSKSKSS